MLDEYIDIQPVAHKIILNQLNNKNVSHAYIIETNGYYKGFDFAIAIAKSLICPKLKTSLNDCGYCTQCLKIDNNNYTELEIIEPDGLWIKKEQLKQLQKDFNSKSVEGNKKIYIINHADKMNDSASNSILKFLEEPEEGIIAILVVENSNSLLETIVSRCQRIKLNNQIAGGDDTLTNICYCLFNNEAEIENFKKDEKDNNIIENTVGFIVNNEESGIDIFLHENKYCSVFLKNKNMFKFFLDIMVLFYKDVLNYMLFNKVSVFVNDLDDIKYVADKNKIESVLKKTNNVIDICDRLKYNCNLNLLLDKLIMMLEGE